MGHHFMRARKPPTGLTPDFGAIFMSNESTKHECLRNNLFGLPSTFIDFVKHVKPGMLLFLFEYEKRELYGVYEATSDGAIDIMPHAYTASGKKFPAQVQIRTVWNCLPLVEHEFRDAIIDNYYQTSKFHFGLSKHQVYHLLQLFQSKRVWTEEAHLFSTGHACQKELTDDSDFDDQIHVGRKRTELVYPLCNYDKLVAGKDDPIIDRQLISSSFDLNTKKTCSVAYYQPYDHEYHYCHQYPACTGNCFISSPPGPHSSIASEGWSNKLHRATEDVGPFIDSATKNIELGDFIPLHSSLCTISFSPATRNSHPDGCQTGSLSSRHFGKPLSSCRVSPHYVSRRNNEEYEFGCEANDKATNIFTKRKRDSVFSRIKFAPNDSRKKASFNASGDESTRKIMDQLQRNHDNWSKGLNRKKFNGHEKVSSIRRRESVFSRLRMMSTPIKRDAKGTMKADGTIKSHKMNSSQKSKMKLIAKGANGIEVPESNSGLVVKVEIRPTGPESSSPTQKQRKRRELIWPTDLGSSSYTQKQSKRIKLIRPVLGLRPLIKESVTDSKPDSQFTSEEHKICKDDSGSFAVLAEESHTLVEGKVSSESSVKAEGSDKVVIMEAVHEVGIGARTSCCLQVSKENSGSLVGPAEEVQASGCEALVSCKSSYAEAEGSDRVTTKKAGHEVVVEAGISSSLHVCKEGSGSLVVPAEDSLASVGEWEVSCKSSCAEAEGSDKVTIKEAKKEVGVEAGTSDSLQVSKEALESSVAAFEDSLAFVGEGLVGCKSSCAGAEVSDKVTREKAEHEVVVQAGTSGSIHSLVHE